MSAGLVNSNRAKIKPKNTFPSIFNLFVNRLNLNKLNIEDTRLSVLYKHTESAKKEFNVREKRFIIYLNKIDLHLLLNRNEPEQQLTKLTYVLCKAIVFLVNKPSCSLFESIIFFNLIIHSNVI